MTEGITMLKLREAAALDLLRYKNGPQPVDLRSMADAQTVIRASRHPMTTTEQERERK